MKKRKLVMLLGSILLVLMLAIPLALACAGPTPSPSPSPSPTTAEPVVWKASCPYPDSITLSRTFTLLLDEIEKRSDGMITFERFYGGALLNTDETLDGVAAGVAQIGQTSAGYHPGRLPLGALNYAFPFPSRSTYVIMRTEQQLYKEFPAFHKELENENLHLAALGCHTDYGISCNKPIPRFDDLKGKKISMLGGYFGAWFEPTGAIPVAMTWVDAYEATRTGTIDGNLGDAILFEDGNEWEIEDYFVTAHLGAKISPYVLMNLDAWNSLTPEQQTMFDEARGYVEENHAQYSQDYLPQSWENIKAHGVTVIEWPEEDIQKWISMVPDTPAQFAKDYEDRIPEIWDIIKRVQEIQTSYGYVWSRQFGIRS